MITSAQSVSCRQNLQIERGSIFHSASFLMPLRVISSRESLFAISRIAYFPHSQLYSNILAFKILAFCLLHSRCNRFLSFLRLIWACFDRPSVCYFGTKLLHCYFELLRILNLIFLIISYLYFPCFLDQNWHVYCGGWNLP